MEESSSTQQVSMPRTGMDKPFGPVAAVFLAAGIGALVLGVLTTLAEANESFKSWLEWSTSVGSLSGKTIIAVIAFVVAWVVFGIGLRGRNPKPSTVFTWTAVLVAVGLVLTFPTFFQAFAPEE
ncbi:MAG TPA: hypothetical protein VFM85_04680 [Actinomycetota bacterium]|nr:hypothetical protein [Actinomycetota bacterium]